MATVFSVSKHADVYSMHSMSSGTSHFQYLLDSLRKSPTSMPLRSIIYDLITHPKCYHKLQNEIDEFKAQGKLSDPVQMKDANEMPYLQAVMKEAMRLHPSV